MGNSRICILLQIVFFLSFSFQSSGVDYEADVVIYGGTSAAISAAVQVKKMGKSVLVVSPDEHLGGLSSSGLGWTDSGKKEAIGGAIENHEDPS